MEERKKIAFWHFVKGWIENNGGSDPVAKVLASFEDVYARDPYNVYGFSKRLDAEADLRMKERMEVK